MSVTDDQMRAYFEQRREYLFYRIHGITEAQLDEAESKCGDELRAIEDRGWTLASQSKRPILEKWGGGFVMQYEFRRPASLPPLGPQWSSKNNEVLRQPKNPF